MKQFLKTRSLDSVIFNVEFFHFQVLKASIHSKPLRTRTFERNHRMREAPVEEKDLVSIFNSITEIICTKDINSQNEDSFGISMKENTHFSNLKVRDDQLHGSQGVCRIADESMELGTADKVILEETHLGDQTENDCSPIVRKITEILRSGNSAAWIEERLENAGVLLNPEIVENVLKRCFKVGSLGFRFFNWVKLQSGFRHTTGTYNTMISIAGEAKEFDLVEKLVEDMEKDLCPKDIKTWTILISSYGKARLIGKALLVFEKMKKSGCEPDGIAHKLIVRALCNAGKPEIAMEFYKEMVSKNIEVDMNFYKQLLSCLSRSGDPSVVRLVGNDMINISQIPEEEVYSCILRCYCISGRITKAFELLHELKSKHITLDPGNFEILVKGLCWSGRIGDALEIVEIMKQNKVLNENVYGIVINGYLKKNEISRALEIFSRMKESGYMPPLPTYTELMQHLFRSNKYERGCELYGEMLESGVEPDIVTITALIAGHVQNNHVSEASRVFQCMKDKGTRITPKCYTVFIKELCKVSRPKEALKLLHEAWNANIKIRDEIVNLVLSSLEKKGEVESINAVNQMWRASKLYIRESELHVPPIDHQSYSVETGIAAGTCEPVESKHNKKPEQLQPLPKSYTERDFQEIFKILLMDWGSMQEALEECTIPFTPELVLDVLCSCGNHGRAALSFFSWVGKKAGYSHTTETYNMAIKISGGAKDFKHMRRLFLEMKRRHCLVTSDTWTIMIMQYGRVGLTEIALKYFKEMKSDGHNPTRSTYKYLLVSLCQKKGCKGDEAIKIFNEMIHAGFVPDKELAEIYLNRLCEVGKCSDARKCKEQLLKSGFSVPLSYSLVVRALCRAGKIDEALELVDEVGAERSTLEQYIYGSLVHGLLRGGRLEDALAKVEKMKQSGINPTVHVYTSLMVHFFKEKQTAKALETFKKMREEGCEPTIVTYSALVRGYLDVEMVSEAWNLFRLMKLKGPFPDFKTYSMFISSLCKIGRSEESLQLIHEMLDSGIFPSTVNFRTVYYGLNREGKRDLAQTVLEKKWTIMSNRKFLS